MEIYNINLNSVYNELEKIKEEAMLKEGGTFTGNVIATSTNRKGICVRNISISDGSNYFETDRIIMQRK